MALSDQHSDIIDVGDVPPAPVVQNPRGRDDLEESGGGLPDLSDAVGWVDDLANSMPWWALVGLGAAAGWYASKRWRR